MTESERRVNIENIEVAFLCLSQGSDAEYVDIDHFNLATLLFSINANARANLCLDDLAHAHRSIGVQRSSSTTASGY